MRDGYILLHRKGITQKEWKYPRRTLAWIDFCTIAAYEDFMAEDGVWIRKGEVIASYGFLAKRWRVSKSTAHDWMQYWIAERQVERSSERCIEREAERFFIVNYAKYQKPIERSPERRSEHQSERAGEQMKRRQGNEDNEKKNIEVSFAEILDQFRKKSMEMEFADEAYADKTAVQAKKLSGKDREELCRKIGVFLNCCKSGKQHSNARIIFSEIAGFVNDKGDMLHQLTDCERHERQRDYTEPGQ